MLTYELKKRPGVPLYEALYRAIRDDILSGRLQPGEKLPARRALAEHLEVSRITVEAAYNQLLAEGYLRSQERVGCFVEDVARPDAGARCTVTSAPEPEPAPWPVDLTGDGAGAFFPFSVWMRLQREVMLDYGERLLSKVPNLGCYPLRQAISEHLRGFRGMEVRPENILIGAGTDFLYNLLIQLLGRDKVCALEEPGYGKIRRIYAAGGVRCLSAPVDREGICLEGLDGAQVLHTTPLHHFPTGVVTSPARRSALLEWVAAAPDRYLIEDDYDSEFRFDAHPVPALCSLDSTGRVIYMNSFSKTLAPSIRISYMILPDALMERFRRELGFYGCTVPSFEQYTLARFLSRGYFEKHINRMRKLYRARRNRVLQVLRACPLAHRITVQEQDAGLHFLLRVDTELSGRQLVERCAGCGIRVRTLAEYYHDLAPEGADKTLVINYSALDDEALPAALERLWGTTT